MNGRDVTWASLGADSETVAESDAAGNLSSEYVYVGGKRVARIDSNDLMHPKYYISDHLGSASVVASDAGVSLGDSMYFPYGGERWSNLADSNHYKFTGKERDTETGLDYFGARYYGSTMGRFQTPDLLLNSGHPADPQSWNRYSYTLNNPLKFIDPTGLYNLVNDCAQDNKKCNKQFEQNAKNLKQGLSDLQKKVDKMKDGAEKTRLQNALKSMGTENDGNNVGVKFGVLPGTAAGNTRTMADDKGSLSFNVTFDPSKITGGTNDWAIDAAHEGTHVNDTSNPLFANDATTLSPFQQEYRGYQTSAWAAQALGMPSLSYGSFVIWNSSWGAVDRQTLMDRGITQHVTSIPGHPDTKPDQHNPWSN